MNKLISVVIPTFNRPELTYKAINSVKSLNPNVVEIVVIDDKSLIPFQYPALQNAWGIDVKIIILETNCGAGVARSFGVKNAAGSYIAFLDSDDTYTDEWIDTVLNLISETKNNKKDAAFIGRATNGKGHVDLIFKFFLNMPSFSLLAAIRFVAIFFNSFYTPACVFKKELCQFSPTLRFCEDYYTSTFAFFQVEQVTLIDVPACQLGRAPTTIGGQSGNRQAMNEGEMSVRMSMLKADCIPIYYKVLIPLGMLYQIVRTKVRTLFFS